MTEGIPVLRTTREKIIDAARKVFSRKGYLGASLKEIAIEAGVSKSLILWYFGSKKNLARTVALQTLPRQLIESCIEKSSDAIIDCIVDKFLEKYSSRDMRRLLLFTFAYQAYDEEIDKEISRLCSSTIKLVAQKVYGDASLENRVKIRSIIGALICYILTPHECIEPKVYGEIVKKLFKNIGKAQSS